MSSQDPHATAHAYARRFMGSIRRRMDPDEYSAVIDLAVVVAGDEPTVRQVHRATWRELVRAARSAGLGLPCQVPECGREEVPLRRGRCSRCARRAERGGWVDQDPSGDFARWVEWVQARPASRLALARVGVPAGRSGKRLAAHRNGLRQQKEGS